MIRHTLRVALCSAVLLVVPAAAQAQVFVSPFAGFTTGEDSPGERPTGGVSVLFMGNAAGLELEAGFTPDFFDDGGTEGLLGSNSVTTMSANLLLGIGAGPVRPYATGGVGLLRSRISSADGLFDDISENDMAVNAGAGIIVMFSEHAGVRGDARYFRGLQEIDAGDLSVSLGTFDFWRAYAGLSFGF